MIEQKLIDNNRAIAVFMGMELMPMDMLRYGKEWHEKIAVELLTYHKDWNHLMPVVEKIAHNHNVNIMLVGDYGCLISNQESGNIMYGEAESTPTLIEAVYQVVSAFVNEIKAAGGKERSKELALEAIKNAKK